MQLPTESAGGCPYTQTTAAVGVRGHVLYTQQSFARLEGCASFDVVDVVLRKLGRKGGRVVAGRLVRAPRSGSVVVIEFPDGLHEYVTTPVKRVLRLAGDDVFFVQTANSCYRLEVRSGQEVMLDSVAK
jgi:hypothetical protein